MQFSRSPEYLCKSTRGQGFQAIRQRLLSCPELDEPDEPVSFLPPPKLDENVIAALSDAAAFYHRMLRENPDRFSKVVDYLSRRGVDVNMVAIMRCTT